MPIDLALILAFASICVGIAVWFIAAVASFEKAKRNYVSGAPRPALPEGSHLKLVAHVNGTGHNLVRDRQAADAVLSEVNWDFPLAVPPRAEGELAPEQRGATGEPGSAG